MRTSSVFLVLGLTIVSWSAKADDKWDINKLDTSKLPPPADQKGVTYANSNPH